MLAQAPYDGIVEVRSSTLLCSTNLTANYRQYRNGDDGPSGALLAHSFPLPVKTSPIIVKHDHMADRIAGSGISRLGSNRKAQGFTKNSWLQKESALDENYRKRSV
jgi:hypothetical protein